MMIEITTESLIPLRNVPAWCKEHLGNKVHLSTVHRWRLRGAHGVKLETILAGGRRLTSHEALERFFREITNAADGDSHTLITGTMDSKAIDASIAELKACGLMGADDDE